MAEVIAALCRHASYRQPDHTPSAHLLYPLTAEGQGQARTLGQRLRELAEARGYRLHPVIDSSPLQRAYQTAAIVAETLSGAGREPFTVEQFNALNERGLGAAANLAIGEIEELLDQDARFDRPPPGWKSLSDYRLPLPGAESLLEAGTRCAAHLRLRSEPLRAGGDAVLKVFVGHGAAFRHAAVVLGALRLSDLPTLSMHHARPVCLQASENAPWTLVAGQWKARQSQDRPD